MSAYDVMNEMRTMLDIFHRQATISLQKIIACFERSGRTFDAKFRDIFLKMSNNTLTTTYLEVENEYNDNRNQRSVQMELFPQNNKPLNVMVNSTHQRSIDNNVGLALSLTAANVKNETVPGTSSNAIDLAASADNIIVIDSSDDESEAIPDVEASIAPKIELNRIDIVPVNGSNNDGITRNDPPHDANHSQPSSSTPGGNQNENIPRNIEQTETGTNETSDDAVVSSEKTNDSNNPNANNSNNTNSSSASSNVNEVPHQTQIEAKKQMKKCRSCPFVTRFKSNLKIHMKSHAGQKKSFRCHLCFKWFTNFNDVEQHRKIDKHRFRFYCKGCSRGFSFSKQKIVHEEKCKKFRRYECFMCGCARYSLSNIEVHMRNHTGETPYSCDHCRKRYAYLKDLQKHLSVHMDHN